jgi:hypothetical protein
MKKSLNVVLALIPASFLTGCVPVVATYPSYPTNSYVYSAASTNYPADVYETRYGVGEYGDYGYVDYGYVDYSLGRFELVGY